MPKRLGIYLTDARVEYLGPHPARRIIELIDMAATAEGQKTWETYVRLPQEPVDDDDDEPDQGPDWAAIPASDKNPMKLDLGLDWGTYRCPCGCELRTDNHDNDFVAAWVSKHRVHTNGRIIEHTTADGARIYLDAPPDVEREL